MAIMGRGQQLSNFTRIILMNVLMNCNGVYSQQATLAPSLNVVAVGSTAAFACSSSGGSEPTGVTWLLNGSRLEELNLNGVTSLFSMGIGARLRIANVSTDLNSTTIQCRLSTSSGTISPPNAQLSIQGTLERINITSVIIQDQSVSLMWEAPFTLDLTGVDPDITYCVDVMDSLNNTLYSQCGINATSITIPLDTDLMCQASVYTITPVNPAGNGTKDTHLFNASNPACVEEDTTPVVTITTTVVIGANTTVRTTRAEVIAGIVAGGTLLVIFLTAITIVIVYKHKHKQNKIALNGKPKEDPRTIIEDEPGNPSEENKEKPVMDKKKPEAIHTQIDKAKKDQPDNSFELDNPPPVTDVNKLEYKATGPSINPEGQIYSDPIIKEQTQSYNNVRSVHDVSYSQIAFQNSGVIIKD